MCCVNVIGSRGSRSFIYFVYSFAAATAASTTATVAATDDAAAAAPDRSFTRTFFNIVIWLLLYFDFQISAHKNDWTIWIFIIET